MVRDTSQHTSQADPPITRDAATQLRDLGWHDYFWDQVDPPELTQSPPVRITQVHRNRGQDRVYAAITAMEDGVGR